MVETSLICCLGADVPYRLLRGERDVVAILYFSPILHIAFLLAFAPSCLCR